MGPLSEAQVRLMELIEAWRQDIESAPFPEMPEAETAVANWVRAS
jgi:hypothetical protein